MRALGIFLIVLCAQLAVAQVEKSNVRYTIRGNIGIPKPLSSSRFRTSFTGVYEGNISVNMRLFKNVFAGVGYENTLHQNNKKIFVFYQPPNTQGIALSYDTRMLAQGYFLKIGNDKFFSETGYMSYSLNSGLMNARYINVIPDNSAANQPFTPAGFTSGYVQPEMSVNFNVERHLGFSVQLSYTTMFYRFNAKAPRFAHIGEVAEKKNNFIITWFNIGFGFTVLLGK